MKALHAIWLCLALVLCQCGTPPPPTCRILPRASRGDAPTQVEQARQAWRSVASARSEAERESAVVSYNEVLKKLVDRLHCGSGSIHDKAAKMGTVIDESWSLGAGIRIADLDALVPAASA